MPITPPAARPAWTNCKADPEVMLRHENTCKKNLPHAVVSHQCLQSGLILECVCSTGSQSPLPSSELTKLNHVYVHGEHSCNKHHVLARLFEIKRVLPAFFPTPSSLLPTCSCYRWPAGVSLGPSFNWTSTAGQSSVYLMYVWRLITHMLDHKFKRRLYNSPLVWLDEMVLWF